MTSTRRAARSPYMEWSKLRSATKFNLATSGLANLPLAELDVSPEQLEITGPSAYGYPPLIAAIAHRYRVPPESVVSTMGTSLANYLALAATTEPGDEILVEHPTYGLILDTARYLGLSIQRFARPAENSFAIDLAEVEKNLTARTRLIVLCNLHNPSGASVSDIDLQVLSELARKVGAYVVVDEVYREMRFEAEPGSAFHLNPERFIVTNSLTKAYGLSGLRCGWVLAPPELAARMYHLIDLHGATFAHPAELLSVIAFTKLGQISERLGRVLETNRQHLRGFLSRRDDLDYYWPEHGTIVFPRLKQGNVDALCELLRKEFETAVVPGHFFEAPNHFRIGVGGSTELVRESLQQLGDGLDQYDRNRGG